MVQAVRMPMLGNTMEVGFLAEWHASEGDDVTEGDTVAVVESEKASSDVSAKQDGTLARIDVEEGEEVPPGTVIGVILGPDENLSEAPEPRTRIEPTEGDVENEESEPTSGAEADSSTPASRKTEDRVPAAPGARALAADHGIDLESIDGTGPEGEVLRIDVEERLESDTGTSDASSEVDATPEREEYAGRSFASPNVRQIAREHGISLAAIEGTGVGGRVTETDVRVEAGLVTPATSESAKASTERALPTDVARVAETRELSAMRQTIADRMVESAQEAPHVTLNREVPVDRALDTVDELANSEGASIGITDILTGAVVAALDTYPRFNAWFDGEQLALVEEFNVAFAVDTADGLVTPVVRDVGSKTLDEIASDRRSLTERVRTGSYTMDDLRGGTFTISNLGMFGVDSFDPIINPPQVAILGVGRIRDRTDTRTFVLSLSFDHRVVDGADAARFIDKIVDGVTSPSLVVADRSSVGGKSHESAGEAPDEVDSESSTTTEGDLSDVVTADIEKRAKEVATAHDWPLPDFAIDLSDGDRPTVVVRGKNGTSPATLRRLTYAACRESEYANVISGLRDPDIVVG